MQASLLATGGPQPCQVAQLSGASRRHLSTCDGPEIIRRRAVEQIATFTMVIFQTHWNTTLIARSISLAVSHNLVSYPSRRHYLDISLFTNSLSKMRTALLNRLIRLKRDSTYIYSAIKKKSLSVGRRNKMAQTAAGYLRKEALQGVEQPRETGDKWPWTEDDSVISVTVAVTFIHISKRSDGKSAGIMRRRTCRPSERSEERKRESERR